MFLDIWRAAFADTSVRSEQTTTACTNGNMDYGWTKLHTLCQSSCPVSDYQDATFTFRLHGTIPDSWNALAPTLHTL